MHTGGHMDTQRDGWSVSTIPPPPLLFVGGGGMFIIKEHLLLGYDFVGM